ncbi:hypothetical protein [Klebsiella pneumoniae]|uniref:hypothetical protein n=1 Tax=Klebsiella pneumoniae TaxID=573 RepID=UPI00190E4748|nr:hypothetical protein [Klebsiella pneumoniae]
MALYEEKYQLKGNELMNRLLEQVDVWKYVNKYKSKKQQKAAFCRQSLLHENEQ